MSVKSAKKMLKRHCHSTHTVVVKGSFNQLKAITKEMENLFSVKSCFYFRRGILYILTSYAYEYIQAIIIRLGFTPDLKSETPKRAVITIKSD